MIRAYRDRISALLEQALEHGEAALAQAAERVARAVRAGGIVHVFGSGHSSLVAAEVVGRSGSLVPVNQIVDRTEDLAERLEGYGTTLMAFYEQQYQLLPEDCLIVVSNSGRNPLPIEVALAGRARGLSTIAITNVAQSRALASRHSSGQRLFEVAELVLDSQAPFGETALSLPRSRQAVAPVSSFPALFLIHSLLLAAAEQLEQAGEDVPLFQSENGGDEDAARRNAELRRRYAGRLRRFGV